MSAEEAMCQWAKHRGRVRVIQPGKPDRFGILHGWQQRHNAARVIFNGHASCRTVDLTTCTVEAIQ